MLSLFEIVIELFWNCRKHTILLSSSLYLSSSRQSDKKERKSAVSDIIFCFLVLLLPICFIFWSVRVWLKVIVVPAHQHHQDD